MDAIILDLSGCELTLYTLSLIKSSISFWEHPEIKADIRNWASGDKFRLHYRSLKDWDKIIRKVMNLADDSELIVASVLGELKDAILNTGLKIQHWIWYCAEILGLDVSYAENILWTPLGFVDEEKIFNCLWKNDASLYKSDKPKIFEIACMFAQEEFIGKHQIEIIEKWHIDLELKSYSDKVYGIISTYLKQNLRTNHYVTRISFPELKNYDGTFIPPVIMFEACVLYGVTHGVRYYHKNITSTQKEELNAWIKENISDPDFENWMASFWIHHDFRTVKSLEVKAFLDYSDYYLENETSTLDALLYLCPLDSIAWPYFKKWLKNEKYNVGPLVPVVKYYFYTSVKSNFHQKFLKKILFKISSSNVEKNKEILIRELIRPSIISSDFTILKAFLDNCKFDPEYFKRHLRRIHWNVECNINLDVIKKFYDDMFKSSDERVKFFTEQFHSSYFLMKSDFDKWEKSYIFLNFIETPLRDSIDPLKCLRYLATGRTNIETLDKFINWWHEFKQDQMNLKNKFKNSSFLPDSIYIIWLREIVTPLYNCDNAGETEKLLKYIFESEDDIVQFKKNRLSVSGLLGSGFQISWDLYGYRFYLDFEEKLDFKKNSLYVVIKKFVTHIGEPGEAVSGVDLREKVEDLILRYSNVSVCREKKNRI